MPNPGGSPPRSAARRTARPVIPQGWQPAPRGSTRPSYRASDRHLHPRRHRRAMTSRRRGGGVARPRPAPHRERAMPPRTAASTRALHGPRCTTRRALHAPRAARSTLHHTPRAAPCDAGAMHSSHAISRAISRAASHAFASTPPVPESALLDPDLSGPARALPISFPPTGRALSEPPSDRFAPPHPLPSDVFPPWHRSSTRDRRASPCSSRAKRDLTVNTPARAALQIA